MSLRLWLLATVLGTLGGFGIGQLIEEQQRDYLQNQVKDCSYE
jgi:ABC-type phosphate/phosphonate transport system permease subunit